MTIDEAIRIAWGIKDPTHGCPRPSADEALQILKNYNPGHTWLTGQAACDAVREHLDKEFAFTLAELVEAEDEGGITHVGSPAGNGIAAQAAQAAAKELTGMWQGWFNEGLSPEEFSADVAQVIEYLRQWERAVIARVRVRHSGRQLAA